MSELLLERDLSIRPHDTAAIAQPDEHFNPACEPDISHPKLMRRERLMPYALYLLGKLDGQDELAVNPARQPQPNKTIYPRAPIKPRQGGSEVRGRPSRIRVGRTRK